MMNNGKKNQTFIPIIGMIIAIISISTASIFIRFLQPQVSSLSIATYRLVLSGLLLLPLYLYKSDTGKTEKFNRRIIQLIGLSSLFLALHFAFWISSLEKTGITSSVVLVTTTPIWVSLLSKWVLSEEVSPKVWFGIFIAFMGIIIITGKIPFGIQEIAAQDDIAIDQPSHSSTLIGNLFALAGAFCAAGYVLVGKIVRRSISVKRYIFLVYSGAGLILLFFSLITGNLDTQIRSVDWVWILLLALIPQVIGHSLINQALGSLPAVFVSISLLGEPIGSTILAYFFLNELASINEIMGGVIILTGIMVASLPGRR